MSATWCWPQELVQPEMFTRTPPTSARPASSSARPPAVRVAMLDRDVGAPAHRRRLGGRGDAGGRVAVLLYVLGDAARPRDRRPQELALLDDALAQLVDAHGVEQPLHAGPELVV